MLPSMARGFEEDEGWWAVGLHLFVICAFAGVAIWLADVVLAVPLVKSYLPLVVGSLVGVTLGNQTFHGLRDRYLRRQRSSQVDEP
ncbi:hypothetical protein ACNAW0_17775 [Micromonospora sp. SL1-18]|uniref:hypothetical protein n=1 Tax=Micromonospora sp. SL1-18 TaxID=3399128 RepID=UPI003A4E63AD